jgi:hypothetical protein
LENETTVDRVEGLSKISTGDWNIIFGFRHGKVSFHREKEKFQRFDSF